MILRNRASRVFYLTLLIFSIGYFFLPATISEQIYGNGLYPMVRRVFSFVTWIPIPLIYLLIILLIILLWFFIRSEASLVQKGIKLLIGLVMGILAFYWLWAFNYSRTNFDTRFPITVQKIDSISLEEEMNWAKADLEKVVTKMTGPKSGHEIEDLLRPDIKSICASFDYISPGKMRVKKLYPTGILLRIGTAGFYLPFAGEAYVDAGLVTIQMPFTMAHEMCHGYGATDEGACNFLAYLACRKSTDSFVVYSGAISYFRQVAGIYRYVFPEKYKMLRSSLSVQIQKDLDDINANILKYPDIFPQLRDAIYDNYLKMQGVREGMESYDRIIDMVRSARAKGLLE